MKDGVRGSEKGASISSRPAVLTDVERLARHAGEALDDSPHRVLIADRIGGDVRVADNQSFRRAGYRPVAREAVAELSKPVRFEVRDGEPLVVISNRANWERARVIRVRHERTQP